MSAHRPAGGVTPPGTQDFGGATNGLSTYLVGPLTFVQLGGVLTQTTTIDGVGNAHSFNLIGLDTLAFGAAGLGNGITDLTATNVTNVDLCANEAASYGTKSSVLGGGTTKLKTPEFNDGTRTVGQVYTLKSIATGEGEYEDVALSTYEVIQGVGNPAATVTTSGIANAQTIPFVQEVQPNADYSVAAGVVIFHKAGKFKLTADATFTTLAGSSSAYAMFARLNGVDDYDTLTGFTAVGTTMLTNASATFVFDVVATDTVDVRFARTTGNSNATTLAASRLVINQIG